MSAWISNGGEFVVAPTRYMPLTVGSSTNTATSTALGNDVFGQVSVTVTGTVVSGAALVTVTPPIPLPESALVWVSPANSKTALTSGVSTVTNAYFASVNEVGVIVIGSVGDTAGPSTASTVVINYFVAQ